MSLNENESNGADSLCVRAVGKRPSVDSEYDECLAISDGDAGSPSVTFADGTKYEESDQITALPFKTVHNAPQKFKALNRSIFIPGQEIHLQFTEYDRSITTHLLNPNLYTIELKHGDFTWTLKKRYKHIQHLHQQLRIFRASLNVPFPTKTHRERRNSYKLEVFKSNGKSSGSLPRFPAKSDALVPDEEIEHRMRQLEEYLSNLLKISLYRNHHEVANFLEVSHLSFVDGLGDKGKEGAVLKRTRSAAPGRAGCNLCGVLDCGLCVRCNYVCSDMCGGWRNRWLIVRDSFVAYIRPKDGRVKCVMLYDSGFEVSSGVFSTGLRRGLHILNLSRQITIKCPTRRITREWMAHIKDVAHKEDAACLKCQCVVVGGAFTQRNRYYSFAPVREGCLASWFVDGRDYMEAVANALCEAREEIYIANWWLSPEIHMKRPAIEGDYWRIDKILQRKADEGIKVFVLLYKEVEMAMGINSYYSKQRLAGKETENIKILRHPDHAKAGVFLWSHHEKLVVVDQSIAFLGGIDLCYGRWDDPRHRLTDLGSVSHSLSQFLPQRRKQTSSRPLGSAAPSTHSLFTLARATNTVGVSVVGLADRPARLNLKAESEVLASIQDEGHCEAEDTVDSYVATESDPDFMVQPSPENIKCDTPEMERKTILEVVKENVKSRGREWMTYLNMSNDDVEGGGKENVEEGEQSVATVQTTDAVDELGDEPDSGFGNGLVSELSGSAKLWVGKDYTNFIVKDFNNLDLPYQDLVDRGTTPRMPWHDIGTMIQGAAARDIARHFIQRWNAVKLEKAKLNPLYPYLLPKAYKEFGPKFELPDTREHNVTCQVVRSVGHWSAGFLDVDTWESSIHDAYVDAIAKSNHYVYIENQFFITLASLQVKNQVGDAIFKRVVRAYREGTVFRVYIVIPLLPGFEGEVGSPSGTALHAVTHWNYASISCGKESLLSRLKAAGIPDPSEYVTFYGLRTHSVLNGDLVTELIYVHSKVLISDDRLVICGSANINDRSLLGKRDSEVAVVIQDVEFSSGRMNGCVAPSGKYCGSLRRRLFREHLGLLEPEPDLPQIDLIDPTASEFYNDVWRKTACENTQLYEKVFHCIPSDQATSFLALKKYQDETPLFLSDPIKAAKMLQNVRRERLIHLCLVDPL